VWAWTALICSGVTGLAAGSGSRGGERGYADPFQKGALVIAIIVQAGRAVVARRQLRQAHQV
jgi:hypothetical protein